PAILTVPMFTFTVPELVKVWLASVVRLLVPVPPDFVMVPSLVRLEAPDPELEKPKPPFPEMVINPPVLFVKLVPFPRLILAELLRTKFEVKFSIDRVPCTIPLLLPLKVAVAVDRIFV